MAYRTAAEVPAYDDDPVPLVRKESALFRMALLLTFIAGPCAVSAGTFGLVQVLPPVALGFGVWALCAYVGSGIAMIDSKATRDWNWRLKVIGFTWGPYFLVGWLTAIAFKWVVRGDKDST